MSKKSLFKGETLLKEGNYQQASIEFEKTLHLDPSSLPALRGVIRCYANLHLWLKALNASLDVLGYGRHQLNDLMLFLSVLEQSQLSSYVEPIEKTLIIALDSYWLEGRATQLLTQQVLIKYSSILVTKPEKFNDDVNCIILDPSLGKLIERTYIINYNVEKILLIGRQELLKRAVMGQNIADYIPFLSSLACQTLLNDDLYFTLDEEKLLLNELATLSNKEDIASILLQICYGEFYEKITLYKTHKKTLNNSNVKNITDDLSFYLDVILDKNKGQIKDSTSKKVQSFYMENPYPKWKQLTLSPITIKQMFQYVNKPAPAHVNVLVAGCGTGKQVIELALTNTDITITAIDLSPTSLAFAKLMAKRYKIKNINFRLLDILDVKKLNKHFDYIMCTGVLHHMAVPQAGLNALVKVLQPTGIMLLGLYSKAARKDLSIFKNDILTSQNIVASDVTSQQVSQWRSQLHSRAAKNQLLYREDFFYLNGLMDLLFHPQQAEYSLIEVQTMLNNAQLSFQKMAISQTNRTIYKEAMQKFYSNNNTETLSNWHDFELENPLYFQGMINFFVTLK